jgi:hypothetical protein
MFVFALNADPYLSSRFYAGFKVLSEAERTAALYSLLQHSTQVQIRFFITVLQQMARSDPMTALLSPAMGGKCPDNHISFPNLPDAVS